MEALIASYGDASSDSDSDTALPANSATTPIMQADVVVLPPPPVSLLTPPNSIGLVDHLLSGQPNRVRSFSHVEGNFPLHVYIPVYIPPTSKKEVVLFLKRISSSVPTLHVVDADAPLDILCKDDNKLEQVALGTEFHISLGSSVPIRVHQIDSVIAMLRHRFQFQKRYWIDFNKLEVFINDDKTRTFLSMEVVTGGLTEDPRPHISLAWASGDVNGSLKRAVEEETKRSIGVQY